MNIGALLSTFIFNFLIPIIFTILLVVFLWGLFYYLIAGGHDEEAREKAKALLMYGFVGFVLLTFVWSLFSSLFGGVS